LLEVGAEVALELALDGVGAGAALGAGAAAGVLEGVALTADSFDLDSPPLLLSAEPVAAGVPEADSAGFLPPSRKSVTYQPDPFNWNPAAVN
jgi:hypothetical protein